MKTLPLLSLLKTGRGLNSGAPAVEIDGGEVEVTFIQPRF